MASFRALLLLVTGSLAALFAQTKPAPDPRAREFDFWIGTWQVHANGVLAGHNRIEPILDGAVLQENWTGTKGGSGSSFNYFSPQTQKWHQFWVDGQGNNLPLLTGGLKDGKMVLEGVAPGKDQGTIHRISWTPQPDGSVRQHWETSTDVGKTWSTLFDGLYTKIKP